MAEKVKRTTTKYKSIYFNESTKKYDVKYNFKEYDVKTGKNKYRAKWVYNLNTLTEARQELAKLQTGQVKADDKDITLEGAFELWKIKAQGQDYSPVTINNTTQQMSMIYQFLPASTKLKDIDEEVYYKFCSDIRKHGYADETLYSINATFRKMINLAHKKRLINDNVLNYADNMRTKQKEDYRVVSKEEFDEIDKYFKENEFWRLGVNNYPKYRLLFNLLYYCGLRIGECIALTYADFEEFSYYKKFEEKPVRIAPSSESAKEKHLQGMRVRVVKAYVSDIKLTKSPKSFKKRTIPLSPAPERLFMRIKEEHLMKGGDLNDKIFTWEHGACASMLEKACKALNLPKYTCHEFRHTFISNLIKNGVPLPVIEKVSGDTQATILKRYSHMFESDEVMILSALQNL
ncbi:tyrosine-type recombinase/integrase [Schaedlerella arabinosiphila]|uniref:tyrosine-type recombinase/integrase n=1 Tax=Schaedlerella arabinosiphila TaxID=2044587 RepID=UPI002557D1F4|nr:site-specific integrase [Schaedlerella arabinosiphila]